MSICARAMSRTASTSALPIGSVRRACSSASIEWRQNDLNDLA
jgi:hypothetical protein